MKVYSTGYVDGMLTFADITPQLGEFTPSLLPYFDNLLELDVSGCIKIDSNLFTDCVVACVNLNKLVMKACTQFSQYQIAKFVSNLKSLEYLDVSNGPEFMYFNGYVILSNSNKIRFLNLDPEFKDVIQWKCLFVIFHQVHFGVNITRFFPHNGQYLRHEAKLSEC